MRVLLDCYRGAPRDPVVPARIEGGDYDFDVARHFLEHLEEELPVRASAEALAELRMAPPPSASTFKRFRWHWWRCCRSSSRATSTRRAPTTR